MLGDQQPKEEIIYHESNPSLVVDVLSTNNNEYTYLKCEDGVESSMAKERLSLH